ASTGHAYSYRTCNGDKIVWDGAWTNLYLNTISFPVGSIWDTRAQNMMARWNAVPRCAFAFYVGYDTDGPVSKTNGKNEIYFKNIDGASGTLAVTSSRWNLCVFSSSLSETDVAFDVGESWYTGAPAYSSSSISFQSVALHEFGHSLGLLHENGVLDTMNAY